MENGKFKVGNIVKITQNKYGHHFNIGSEAILKKNVKKDEWLVEQVDSERHKGYLDEEEFEPHLE